MGLGPDIGVGVRGEGGPADPADPPETLSSKARHTLGSTRAWGQDDGSYTNSLKLSGTITLASV